MGREMLAVIHILVRQLPPVTEVIPPAVLILALAVVMVAIPAQVAAVEQGHTLLVAAVQAVQLITPTETTLTMVVAVGVVGATAFRVDALCTSLLVAVVVALGFTGKGQAALAEPKALAPISPDEVVTGVVAVQTGQALLADSPAAVLEKAVLLIATALGVHLDSKRGALGVVALSVLSGALAALAELLLSLQQT